MTRPTQANRRLSFALAICMLLVLLTATGCEPAAQGPLSVLLLVSMDTTRRDRLSAYGYARDTTPSLERLAREGTRFDSAYSPTASTGPTHATLFTGLYPIAHRVLKNGAILAAEHETLAERLARQKYQTAAVVGSFVLDARFGFAQGFDSYDDDFVAHEASIPAPATWQGIEVDGAFDRRANHTSQRAIRWLRDQREPNQPFFLFVHYFDPHMPYRPPSSHQWLYTPREGAADGVTQPRDSDEMSAWYDGEIRFVDDQLADLLTTLDELDLAASTLVVVVADHGEGLTQHGVLSHGVVLYEEAAAIPMLIRAPGTSGSGQVIEEPVELTDVRPTVLELT